MTLDEKFWENYFKVYDLLNILIPYRKVIHSIARELNEKGIKRILDIGSGTGNLSMKLEADGHEVYAIDSSKAGLKIHRSKNPKIHPIEADVTQQLPFENNFFDAICANNVLYTVPRQQRSNVVSDFFRVIKPGGIIVVSDLIIEFSPIKIYFNHIKSRYTEKGFVFTVKEILQLIIPTIKIFYYNERIRGAGKSSALDFFKPLEHAALFKDAGFEIIKTYATYANQAVLTKGLKPCNN